MGHADAVIVCSLPLAKNDLHSPTSTDVHSHEPQRYLYYAHSHSKLQTWVYSVTDKQSHLPTFHTQILVSVYIPMLNYHHSESLMNDKPRL